MEKRKSMSYCIKCGHELIEKENGIDGMVPYCPNCQEFRFPMFNSAVSALVLNPKKDKILLIQQYGRKDNILIAGYVTKGENAKQALFREIKEETGCDVELNGVCYIANRILEDDLRIMVFFNAKLVNENIKYDKNEILDVKWIGYDEIMNKMDDELRGSYVKTAVYNKKNNLIAPIEIVDVLND